MPKLATSGLLAEPYDYSAARLIAAELALAEPVAITLVRRGIDTVAAARTFLEADERHDPFEFEGMQQVCERLLAAARGGEPITVHGDYDVDGVSSTAIMVAALRRLGARCDWFIPDRLGDGYGLTAETVARIAARGSKLIVTVDCGISSVAEVELAAERGIEVIVTDHHHPPERLPDCPILHPSLSGYPFTGLCAAGVAHKLAAGLRRVAGEPELDHPPEADLVALATVADLVPLEGENRRLVREGLTAIQLGTRPGLRALIAVSSIDSAAVTEQDLAFRLAPRINAAGRLFRADAGVELMLCDEGDRAAAIAAELDRANHERRAIERDVANAAERYRTELAVRYPDAAALVVAGEGWHPGVVGIVASRLCERHGVPAIVIGLERGRGRGSGRSVAGFDLLAGLDACSSYLTRYGGHQAAAGLEIEQASLEAFREAFLSHAREAIDPGAPKRPERVDAMVGVGSGESGIGVELAEQFERLGPFGIANPNPVLLVPSGRLRQVSPLGEEGRHSRFELHAGVGAARGVAFGVNGALAGREGESLDMTVGLELNRWNGSVEPRLVMRSVHDATATATPSSGGCGSGQCPAPDAEWWPRFQAELERELRSEHSMATRRDGEPCESPLPGSTPLREPPPLPESSREVIDRRGGAAIAAIVELLSSGEPVLAICADGARRRELAGIAGDPRRFGAPPPSVICRRCGERALDAVARTPEGLTPGSLTMVDWDVLDRHRHLAGFARHLVIIDPPRSAADGRLGLAPFAGPGGPAPFAAGFAHLAWGRAELELTELIGDRELSLRPLVSELYRALRDAGGELFGVKLRSILEGEGSLPRPPEVAARPVRVLRETGLCDLEGEGSELGLRLISSEPTELEASPSFGAYAQARESARRHLRELVAPQPRDLSPAAGRTNPPASELSVGARSGERVRILGG